MSEHMDGNAPHTPAPGTWVLLRGLTREAGHWGHFTPTLQAHLPPGSRIVTPDIAGNGALHQQSSATSVPAMAEQIRQQLTAMGCEPPYSVVAMSLGAMVTVAWMHAQAHELARAVLINTSLRPHSPFWHRLQPRQYPTAARLIFTRPSPLQWEQAVMRMTCQHPPDADQTLKHWLALRAQHPVSLGNGLKQLWAATQYRAPLDVPAQVPTLLLHSARDQLVNPACTRTLAERWQWPVVCHPTAGHDLPLDDGDWVARQIGHWLKTGQPLPVL
jgi:pimeloyl-ACP methyl ester carboxylesterase